MSESKFKDRINVEPRKQLLLICGEFMKQTDYEDSSRELEVRFGTKRGAKPLLKIDYDNVVKKLKSLGFYSLNSKGSYSLKIDTEFLDNRTGGFKSSNIRIEIDGLHAIKEYCETNDISKLLMNEMNSSRVLLMKKGPVKIKEEIIQSADFDDFNFRVSYSTEESIKRRSKIAEDIFQKWLDTKKSFRYINRVSFIKDELPFRIDLSIVKSSTKDRGRLIKTYNTSESNVFNNPESYEIEIELLNSTAKMVYKTPEDLLKAIEIITKYVLSGLQRTNYPISYKEQTMILHEYMKIVHKENFNPNKPVYSSNFIGPSSIALQIKNIAPVNSSTNIPNIREDYVVTEKADGERNLLFIGSTGKIYLINNSMAVMFTGAKTDANEYKNSIIDGELILHNKNGKYINLYAAFDMYYLNDKDIRAFPFMPIKTIEDVKKSRFSLLARLISNLNTVSILDKSLSVPIKITYKKFYPIYNQQDQIIKKDSMSIFDACNYILRNVNDGLYEYNTDGLIFTHTKFGVGSDKEGQSTSIKRWDYSFKWKPPQYNTIDFLVFTKKSPNGLDITTPIFENGLNTSLVAQFNQFKTLVLACGFDEKKHGYINPCQSIIDDKLTQLKSEEYSDTREAMQFFPTDPYDVNAGLCNIMLEEDENGSFQMFTEERQVFNDETIVEFRYDINKEGLWKWIPLRVRYDKTAEYRRGAKNFGNDYNTANSNWFSIHNPITTSMITTGENIPDELAEDDVYYNRITNKSDTQGLRDFHNLFVKKLLIQKVSNRGDTLIDYACGKGGDFPKWIASNLSFVYGIDLSKDNLENRLNGACARFLNFRKEFKHVPYALFVHGNSQLNIRSGQAMLNEKAVQITKAVFGTGSKDIGEGVQRQYGKGEEGFNISSCQFALHYMFEDVNTLHNFIRNVAECTKLNGYFIGTSYDGKTIFNKLRKKKQGESIEIYENKKIWQIIKEYSSSNIEDDESCIGYKISVYQDSINKTIPEYLVNYDYLNRIMEDYGFILLPREDAKKMGFPEGSGMFIELYNLLVNEVSRFPVKSNEYGKSMNMTPQEKEISFLNRYFIYKKIRSVNAEKIANSFINQLPSEIQFEKETKQFQQDTKEAINETIPKVKKLNKKLILVPATDANDEKEINKVKSKVKSKKVVKNIEFDIQET
jgi:hypothetical protein